MQRTRHGARTIGVLLTLQLLLFLAAPAQVPLDEPPALRIHPQYPHYFQGPDGKPLLLIGDYTWGTFSDVDFDYKAQLDALKANGLNFARVWLWWGCEELPAPDNKLHIEPFLRPGPGTANDGRPKYDLTRFNPAFFDRLRDLCAAARERGLYLQLITVDAWMLKHAHLWKLHAFHRDNNANGVDGDPRNTGTGTDGRQGFCSLGNPGALEFQKAYLRKLVDSVNDFDNILIEIANENYYGDEWEKHLSEFVRECERRKPRQHVLMPLDLLSHSNVVQKWDPKVIHAALMEKRRLRQPLIFDTDWTINNDDGAIRRSMWAAVLSGGHFNYMDDSLEFRGRPAPDRRASLHTQIGHLAGFMKLLKPWEMRPDDALVKSGNALAMASAEVLAAYLPAGGKVTLDLTPLGGELEARWFDPLEGTWGGKLTAQGGAPQSFEAPNTKDWTLLIRIRGHSVSTPPSTPARVRAAAQNPSSIRVSWTMATGGEGVAGYKVFRDGACVSTTVLLSHVDRGLEPRKDYLYTVSAFDLSGNESARSAPPAAASTPARAPFCQVKMGVEDAADLLNLVTDPDGDTRPAKVGGVDCREPAGAGDHYFYFAVDDGYLHDESGHTIRLEASYFDDSGFIEPQYDSIASAYTSTRRIELTGTGEWKIATWILRDGRFANRQNAGADFRLHVGPHKVKVSKVKLSVGNGEAWSATPAEPSQSSSRGFAVHPRFPRHFLYQDKPFFFLGKSAFPLTDADSKGFIEDAHRDGFTVLRIWLCCPALTKRHGHDHFQRNQAAGDLWPFGGTPAEPVFSRFNEDYFRRLDALLAYMETMGMVAELTLFAGGDFWPGGAEAWDEVKQVYVQFVLDRYQGQPNLYYEIANEYYSPTQQAFVEKVGDFVWEHDKTHLVTASAGDLARFVGKPWYRLHNFHPSRGREWWERVYGEVLLPARHHRLPLVNDEPMGSRAPDDRERDYPGRDADAAHHRMNLWITNLGGGHVTFHSHKGINALQGRSPGEEFVKPLRTFFEQVRFWELAPAPERVEGTAYVMDSSNELAVYLPKGGAVKLDLARLTGEIAARWFNPREGKFGEPFAVQGGQFFDFVAPGEGDWALHLRSKE